MRKVLGVLVLSLVAMVAFGGTITFTDNFSAPAAPGQISTAPPLPGTLTQTGLAATINGLPASLTRTIAFSVVDPVQPNAATVAVNNNGNGLWTLSTDFGVNATATTTYTFATPSVNLSDYGGMTLTIRLLGNDQPGVGTLSMFVTDLIGNTATVNFNPLGLPVSNLNASFLYGAGLDGTQISSFGFSVATNYHSGQDLALDDFTANNVPEPGTYALMGAGLAALAFLRRRK